MNTASALIASQKQFFATHTTTPITFRIAALKKLKAALLTQEQAILQALHADLKKPTFESYTTELMCVLQEINYAIANSTCWSKPHAHTRLWYAPLARGYVQAQPRGTVLIMAPWNYPVHLTLIPLVGALAAGNCVIIKPSEHAPHTAAALAQLISNVFDSAHVSVVQGDSAVAQNLLAHQFDYIFFTGSTAVGKLVMQQAAQHLTPVTLELGGKSPCIVDSSASIDCAAQRIAWGKFLNAGQSCVAPDYVLVHYSLHTQFTDALARAITTFFGVNPQASPDYGRIINHAHFERLTALLANQKCAIGGTTNRDELYIAPTVVSITNADSPLMHTEIFGPILPIVTYQTLDEALAFINSKPKPLTLYLFATNTATHTRVINETTSGSVCINDVAIQAGSPKLPFGGVGLSGFGSYHSKKSFNTFSHYKTVVKNSCFFNDNVLNGGLRFPPYSKWRVRLIYRVVRWWFTK